MNASVWFVPVSIRRIPCQVLSIFLFQALLGPALPAAGQLISPGELSSVHADLEGITRCTNCHQLGQQGTNNDRCLECHVPIAEQLSQDRGFHNTVVDQNCGDCHKDHFGREFDILRFDALAFDHSVTEYPLVGAHRAVICRSCHQPAFITSNTVRTFKEEHGALENTWLGLSSQCATCHATANVHGDQFSDRDCGACHNENEWTNLTRFDHDQTTFALTGRHIEAPCQGCHQASTDQPDVVRFVDVPAETCESCHLDAHDGALGANCSSCHIADDWDLFTDQFPFDAYDHNLTEFSLTGRHAEAPCSSCHAKPAPRNADIQISYVTTSLHATFPSPLVESCLSCHTDSFHGGVFEDTPGGAVCSNCHTDAGWDPATYDITRHNEESSFPLTGAHLATPCFACHQSEQTDPPSLVFEFDDQSCQGCHIGDNPHGAQFMTDTGATVCADCHGTESWSTAGVFDHAQTRFPLTGKHATTSCASCHQTTQDPSGVEVSQFRGLALECISCHQDDDPHENQFAGQSCQNCHDSFSFFVEQFDHTATRFPLDGAHENVMCSSCHYTEETPQGTAFTRYKPLGTECEDCHNNLN